MNSYSKVINTAVELIKSEGFRGAHSFVFLTRYASLAGDKELMRLVGNSLKDLDDMLPSPMLAYAYAEYFEAAGEEFCASAAEYILSSCHDEPIMIMAYAKCASAFIREDYLVKAMDIAENCAVDSPDGLSDIAFIALGYLELYRATASEDYLKGAIKSAEYIKNNFRSLFDPKNAYDLEAPSGNSAAALLYDSLARITQKKEWIDASSEQNRFISLLADKYPTACSFGLCALLADEYGSNTIICELPGEEYPRELLSLLSYYAPTTEISVKCFAPVDKPTYYRLINGEKEEIAL